MSGRPNSPGLRLVLLALLLPLVRFRVTTAFFCPITVRFWQSGFSFSSTNVAEAAPFSDFLLLSAAAATEAAYLDCLAFLGPAMDSVDSTTAASFASGHSSH